MLFFFLGKKRLVFKWDWSESSSATPPPFPQSVVRGNLLENSAAGNILNEDQGRGERRTVPSTVERMVLLQYNTVCTELFSSSRGNLSQFDLMGMIFFFFNLSMFDSMSSIGQGWHTRVLIWRHGTTVWLTTVSRVRWIASLFQPGLARL